MQKCSSSSVVLCALFCYVDLGWTVCVTFGVAYRRQSRIKAQELHIRRKNGENYPTVGRCLDCRLTNFDVIVVHLWGALFFKRNTFVLLLLVVLKCARVNVFYLYSDVFAGACWDGLN